MTVIISIAPCSCTNPSIVAIDLRPPVAPVIIIVVCTYCGISTPVIPIVWGIVCIPDRVIKSPVRRGEYLAKAEGRSHKIAVKWCISVISVIDVHITSEMIEITVIIVEYPHSTNTPHKIVAIPDVDAANLTNATVVIVENGYILYLNHGTVVIILYKGIVIKPGIKRHTRTPISNIGTNTYAIIDIKIKFAIGVHSKRNAAFCKYE